MSGLDGCKATGMKSVVETRLKSCLVQAKMPQKQTEVILFHTADIMSNLTIE